MLYIWPHKWFWVMHMSNALEVMDSNYTNSLKIKIRIYA